ncbi:MAG: ATP-binding protein [Calditrichaeota bacterium]|nr:MAG: ATP-binding protein [Calditrichota bacterium]
MYIQRKISSSILELMEQFPVVGIVGPRQVGKTTLVKHLVKQINKPCIYLDLELPEDLSKLSDPILYLEQHREKCLILDEIQHLPGLFPVLRGLIDRYNVPGRFIILGSASPELLRQSSETLAGRIAYQELAPFNFTEIADFSDMQTHWFRGGFPPALLARSATYVRTWMRNFIQTYLERDLPMLGLPANPVLMRRFWTMLAHFHGGIWNASNFARALGITSPTVNRYLEFLEAAFLIHRLPPFTPNLKKRLVKSPRIYLRDSGILHFLTGMVDFETLQGHVLIGNSWEGYVIEQIKQIVPQEIDLYYYRTQNGTESDLVLVRGHTPLACIEIKYTTAPKLSKGLQIAIQDLGTPRNFIILPRGESYPLSKNVNACGLARFLTQELFDICT